MPGMTEGTQVGTRRDLSGYIENIQREDTPLFTLLPKDNVRSMTVETLVDDYGDTDNIEGVGSAEDAGNFKDQSEGRDVVTNVAMKMWELPKVDDFSENVNEVEALPAGEYAEQVRKAIVRLKFRMEKLLLSLAEGQRQGGGKKYRTCSIGGHIKSGAPAAGAAQVIPAAARTAAAQIYTGTVSAFKESVITDILQETFEATFGQGKFTGVFGSSLKRAVSLYSIYRDTVANKSVVQLMSGKTGSTLEMKVDIIAGDFGTVTLVPSVRIRRFDAAGDKVTDQTLMRNSGYILDLDRWGLAFKRRPNHKPLPDGGGGKRGIVDTIFALRCKAPKGNGAILPSAA